MSCTDFTKWYTDNGGTEEDGKLVSSSFVCNTVNGTAYWTAAGYAFPAPPLLNGFAQHCYDKKQKKVSYCGYNFCQDGACVSPKANEGFVWLACGVAVVATLLIAVTARLAIGHMHKQEKRHGRFSANEEPNVQPDEPVEHPV